MLGRGPVGRIAGVVVEDHLLDVRVERDLLELAETATRERLDDDRPPDRVELEPGGFDERSSSAWSRYELAHVPVERAREQATASG